MFYYSDVFALGMCILESACLRSSTECYDRSYSIIGSSIRERIAFIKEFYTVEFCNLVASMLEFDIRKRSDSVELWS
jgi:hypothetical protein